MSKINNAPPRFEGPHSQLGQLIREEAETHLTIAENLAKSRPELATKPEQEIKRKRGETKKEWEERKRQARLSRIENGLWQMLTTGWCRPLEDWSGMRFWNPFTVEFEPWSVELNMALIGIMVSMRGVNEAFASSLDIVPDAPLNDGGGCMAGRKMPFLYEDTDESEKLQ